MGQHAEYGKNLVANVAEGQFTDDWGTTLVQYQGGTSAHIDGVVGDNCAIEIESRVDKQIRGALVDLVLHHCSKRLIILIPVHMNDPQKTKEQCEDILNKLKRPTDEVRVVLLRGTGDDSKPEEDKALIRAALLDLGAIKPQ